MSSSFIESLDEEEGLEFELHIYESIDEYITDEMVRYSKSTFIEEMIYCIVEPIYEIYYDAGLCEEEDYDEIYDFVQQRAEVVVETVFRIPLRSRSLLSDSPQSVVNNNDNTDINVITITEQIARLRACPQPEQRTPAWYEFRHNLITASNIGKIFSTDSQLNSLIYEKCRPESSTSTSSMSSFGNSTTSPLHWGNKYEPVSVQIYEHMFKTKVGEFGCIRHPQYSCIGASPDGINIDPTATNGRYGRMLEIKNIVNRDITGIPLEMYWIQMQIQMETCGLDECDFFETRFREYADEAEFYGDSFAQYKGIILYFIDRYTTAASKPTYVYIDLSVLHAANSCGEDERTAVARWTTEMQQSRRQTHILFAPLYWYLAEYSCVLVEKNRMWFNSALPKILDTWRIIEKERVEGYEHRMAKKRADNVRPGLKGGVCLIKLD